jgi:hypothetical protein
MGITLIPIPFWWDKSPASLAATIRAVRADLLQDQSINVAPIATDMPSQYQRRPSYRFNSPQLYDTKVDPTGWFLCVNTLSNSLQVNDGKI